MSTELNSLFTEVAEVAATNQVEELEAKGKLPMPKEQYIKQKAEKLVNDIKSEHQKFMEQMKQARSLFLEDLKGLPEKEQEPIATEIFYAMGALSEEITHEQIEEAGCWQQFLGLSNNTLFWLYKLGNRFFEEKKYEESSSLFSFLTLLNPFIAEHWIALGFTQVVQETNDKALYSFALAWELAPKNPQPLYQLANVCLKLKDFDQALTAAKSLEKLAKEESLEDLKPIVKELIHKAENKISEGE